LVAWQNWLMRLSISYRSGFISGHRQKIFSYSASVAFIISMYIEEKSWIPPEMLPKILKNNMYMEKDHIKKCIDSTSTCFFYKDRCMANSIIKKNFIKRGWVWLTCLRSWKLEVWISVMKVSNYYFFDLISNCKLEDHLPEIGKVYVENSIVLAIKGTSNILG
jgi:hypothetical protein